MIASGDITELTLRGGVVAARIRCHPALVPAPGQYLLAHRPGSASAIPDVLFRGTLLADGFVAVSDVPPDWVPGTHLDLRGPLGHGFTIPERSSRIALIAFDDRPDRLLGLVESALRTQAAVTLVCTDPPDDLDLHIEVQPLSALRDAWDWADYAAVDAARESLPELGKALGLVSGQPSRAAAEVLVRVPMPCGALAECGVCSVRLRKGIGFACDDGPVFDLGLLDLEGY